MRNAQSHNASTASILDWRPEILLWYSRRIARPGLHAIGRFGYHANRTGWLAI